MRDELAATVQSTIRVGSIPVLALLVSLVACGGQSASTMAPLPTARSGFPVYDGDVAVDPGSQSLRASWRISFVRQAATLDSATFLLNPALAISRVGGPHVLGHQVKDGPDPAADMKRLTVRFAPLADADSVAQVHIEHSGKPQLSSDSINSIQSDWVELGLDSFWHPVFEGFSQAIRARMRLTLPAGWTVVSSGSVRREDDTVFVVNDLPLPDVAFVASPSLQYADADGISVHHVDAEPAVVGKVLETAGACARDLNARYGRRTPLPPVKVVLAPRTGPGYARKNYIVIAGIADTATVALARFVCHELAHFWSSGAVPSGPENWLNEAFAEFVTARYVRAAVGESAYSGIVAQWRERGEGQPPIWTPGSTSRPSANVSYRKAPYLLHQLEERVGAAVMDQILVRFMTEPIRTTPALVDMIREVAGPQTAAWFQERLGM